MTDDVRREVLAVYAAADAAIAAARPRCDASGRCCRFTEYGHTLFISAFEAELLLAGVPLAQPRARERPVRVHGAGRDTEGLGGLFDRQAPEEAQFYDAGLPWIEVSKHQQRGVHLEEVRRRLGRGDVYPVEGN